MTEDNKILALENIYVHNTYTYVCVRTHTRAWVRVCVGFRARTLVPLVNIVAIMNTIVESSVRQWKTTSLSFKKLW